MNDLIIVARFSRDGGKTFYKRLASQNGDILPPRRYLEEELRKQKQDLVVEGKFVDEDGSITSLQGLFLYEHP